MSAIIAHALHLDPRDMDMEELELWYEPAMALIKARGRH